MGAAFSRENLKKPDIHFMRASQEYPEGELLRTMCRIFSLDAGEIEALAIIEKNPDAMFLTEIPSKSSLHIRPSFVRKNYWEDKERISALINQAKR